MGTSGLRAGRSWRAEVVIMGDGEAPSETWLTSHLPSCGSGQTLGDQGGGSWLLSPRRGLGERKALPKTLCVAGQRSSQEPWGKAPGLEDFLL